MRSQKSWTRLTDFTSKDLDRVHLLEVTLPGSLLSAHGSQLSPPMRLTCLRLQVRALFSGTPCVPVLSWFPSPLDPVHGYHSFHTQKWAAGGDLLREPRGRFAPGLQAPSSRR